MTVIIFIDFREGVRKALRKAKRRHGGVPRASHAPSPSHLAHMAKGFATGLAKHIAVGIAKDPFENQNNPILIIYIYS